MWQGYVAVEQPGINIFAADLDQIGSFLPGEFDSEAAGWVRYLQALVLEAKEQGLHIPGIKGVLGGNIPVGAGLSSSAAMGTGFLYWLYQYQGVPIDRMKIARIAQAAEHRIGTLCGIMDQFAVLFGQEGKAVRLDCRDLSYAYAPLELEEYILVLINTNVKHTLSDTAYNQRRASCESVLSVISSRESGVRSLRDVTPKHLEAHHAELSAEGIKRVRYVLRENDRVLKAQEALNRRDFQGLGQLLYQSHAGLRDEYEVSCRELDLLVELSEKEKSVLGARMVGGGFGGCTLNLMRREQWQEVTARMAKAYQRETTLKPDVYPVVAANGVLEWESVGI